MGDDISKVLLDAKIYRRLPPVAMEGSPLQEISPPTPGGGSHAKK